MIGRCIVLSLCLFVALSCLGLTGCAPSASSDAPAFSGGGAPPSATTPPADVPTLDTPLPPSTTVPQTDVPAAAGE